MEVRDDEKVAFWVLVVLFIVALTVFILLTAPKDWVPIL